jgi:hypothetical protein
LKDYSDVFAWSSTDLEGIPAELGEHTIDLQEGAVPVSRVVIDDGRGRKPVI